MRPLPNIDRLRRIAGSALLLAATAAGGAPGAALLGTLGLDGFPSALVELDPATGAIRRTIGDVGYQVNGMSYDPTTGVLYATTSFGSPTFADGLLTLDMTTGAGTPVGGDAGFLVNLPAVKSTGEVYAWSQGPSTRFRLVLFDKTTGVATEAGPSGIRTHAHSLAFDAADTLYLLNAGSNLYTIDLGSAAATLVGNVPGLPNGYAHHGSIDPADGLLYALSAKEGGPAPSLLAIDLGARKVTRSVPVDPDIHTLAFAVLPGQVSVVHQGSGAGTVSSTDHRLSCDTTCMGIWPKAPPVTLTATPDANSVFVGWLGPCIGTGPCSVASQGGISVSATFAPKALGPLGVDVDGNGQYDALTDGLLILRSLFGLSGTAVTRGVVAPDAARADPGTIASYITDIRPLLDVDGDGRADALTDGLLILRYLFGLRGDALLPNAVAPGATRTTPEQIESWLQSLRP